MTQDPDSTGGVPPEFAELIRAMFGDQADEALEAFKATGFDPTQLMNAAGLAGNSATVNFITEQVRKILNASPSAGPVNWDLAHDSARQASLASGPDPVVTPAEGKAVADAFSVAELWLDEATEFPRAGGAVRALSSAEWVEATMPQWRVITTPIAESMTTAMATLLSQQGQEHPGMAGAVEGAAKMLHGMAGAMFGMQVGQAVGLLSREVFGFTDTGLPLGDPGSTALLPAPVGEFAGGSGIPLDEARLFLAAREAAHARLFAHVPWLGDHLFGAVEAYASEITINMGRLEDAMRSIDPSDPDALREALAGGVFDLELSAAQRAALRRLETALALVEGWVDVVTANATQKNLPDVGSLREMIRRRRAEGGPAEHTFATLVGLELRPRRAREATRLWSTVTDRIGPVERDAIWAHPDLLPTSDDLSAPDSFLDRREAQKAADAEVDAAIEALLSEEDGPDAPEKPAPQA